jgi:hypothetical protein
VGDGVRRVGQVSPTGHLPAPEELSRTEGRPTTGERPTMSGAPLSIHTECRCGDGRRVSVPGSCPFVRKCA